ncbi:MAG TPA: hypothetical protein VH144_01585 [Candidatus Saccharimonadales bacterium]|jgi:tetratricopeptide (TPR) repeat protein|nr:hypothetical protein [Candidatus Saccharimonadales bacterium]
MTQPIAAEWAREICGYIKADRAHMITHRALEYGNKHHPDYADFWLQLALAYTQCGLPDRADTCRDQAQVCSDYTPAKDEDFRRDRCLGYIRSGRLKEAKGAFQPLPWYHLTFNARDLNRQAAISMTEGILAYAYRDYDRAYEKFILALQTWPKCKARQQVANEQWIRDTRIHLLRAAARKSEKSTIETLVSYVLSDPNEYRRSCRRFARSLRYLPSRLVVAVADRFLKKL